MPIYTLAKWLPSQYTDLFGQLLVVLHQLFVMLFQFVSSILSDLRKDFRSDPSFESFGRFELGGEDECVKSGFVDDNHFSVLT